MSWLKVKKQKTKTKKTPKPKTKYNQPTNQTNQQKTTQQLISLTTKTKIWEPQSV